MIIEDISHAAGYVIVSSGREVRPSGHPPLWRHMTENSFSVQPATGAHDRPTATLLVGLGRSPLRCTE